MQALFAKGRKQKTPLGDCVCREGVPVSKNLATSMSLVSSGEALLSSIAVDRVFAIKQLLCQFGRYQSK
jgi:hypothetical protein